ncbi:MAG: ribosome maturation factor RimP [Methylophilaceae bacterium]|nr:ribosome maturation factor RimP [Methylophilaceae bacterium]
MQNLNAIIEKTVTQLGYELVDFELQNRGRLLRVFIDRPEGISIDDCVLISNQIGNVLAVENDFDYDRLEVSSPGLDRVLKKAADFAKFIGQEASVKLRLAVDGRKNFVGTIVAVTDENLDFQVDGKPYQFNLQQIEKARLVPKY